MDKLHLNPDVIHAARVIDLQHAATAWPEHERMTELLIGLAFGAGYALTNIVRRTPPLSVSELLFGGESK